MIPTISSLERILSNLPSCAPDELMLLGSYAIIARIYLNKGLKTSLYRDTKDIDLYMFPKDEENFLINCLYTPTSFTAHYILNVGGEISAELFTNTSYSDLIGKYSDDLQDFIFEEDKEGHYLHLDKLELDDRTLYIPKLSALILMKVISYGRRSSVTEKDRDDLAFVRGYLPTQYNNALNYIKQRGADYESFKELLNLHNGMFGNQQHHK